MIYKKKTIAIGADHRGYQLKQYLMSQFKHATIIINWVDVGASNEERSDYPEFAIKVCNAMQQGKADAGVLICGTGVGMAITANRFAKIYAALAWNEEVAQLAKEDDNANVLVLPSDFVSNEQALAIFDAWFCAEFKNGRYQQRIALIDSIK